MQSRSKDRRTGFGISRKMMASFCFVPTVREKKEKCVLCVYFIFIFSLFVSDICVTIQWLNSELCHPRRV